MLDQFQPSYFGVAFCFCFKYCVGMQDMLTWARESRPRRPEEAPRIEGLLWVCALARRVGARLKRDWLLGFSQWGFLLKIP